LPPASRPQAPCPASRSAMPDARPAPTTLEGDDHIAEGDARGWQPIAPSAIAFGGGPPRVPAP
jgi:hypothetical protein